MSQELSVPEGQEHALIRPLSTPTEARAALDDFEALKAALLSPGDYQRISGRSFIKRSGWRKIALAFGISCVITYEHRSEYPRGFVWEIRTRATAPNGRAMDSTGTCDSTERVFSHPEHDVRAVAETRAKNRAVSDLVAGGELSAEEMQGTEGRPPREPRAAAAPAANPNAPASPLQRTQLAQHLERTGWTIEDVVRAGTPLDHDPSTAQAAAALRLLSRQPNASA